MARQSKKETPEVLIRRTFQECLERGYSNPVFFANDFLDFDPHEGQVAWLLRSGDPHVKPELRIPKPKAREATLHSANRWGKTQIIAVRQLHRAFYQIRPAQYKYDSMKRLRPYVGVNVSLSLDQAMIGWNYALALAQNAPRFREFIVRWQGTPFPCIEIGNMGIDADKIHSEIWARSTSKGARFLLGKAFNFVSWDECAFQPDGSEILNGVIRMRLVDQAGDLEMYSTPNGKNWFYQECVAGRDYFDEAGRLISDPNRYCQRGESFDNRNRKTGKLNIDEKSVREAMERMTEAERIQNVHGEFTDISSIFDMTSIQRCYDGQDYAHLMGKDGTEGLPPNAEWGIDLSQGDPSPRLTYPKDKRFRYVMGLDPARKRDSTAIVVLRLPDTPDKPCQLVFFQDRKSVV